MQKQGVLILIVLILGAALLFAEGTQEEQTESGMVTEGTGPSYTWDTSPYTIEWYHHDSRQPDGWEPETNKVEGRTVERTGVSVDFQTNAGGSGKERLLTMMAAGNLPDIVTMPVDFPEWRQLQSAGWAADLGELIDQYAPTFRRKLPDSIVKWYTAEDGNWYAFPGGFVAPEHATKWAADGHNVIKTAVTMWARKDLMDKVGVEASDFETKDGMVRALKKFRNANVDYEGRSVYPFYAGAFAGDVDMQAQTVDEIFPAFFAVPMEDSEGNLIYQREHPRYLEVILFFNRLWREGLLARENFAEDVGAVREKGAAGRFFAFAGDFWTYRWQQVMQILNKDPNAVNVPIGPVRAEDGAQPYLPADSLTGGSVTLIKDGAERPDRLIRFLEWLYSVEGHELYFFGIEGETYKIGDDGLYYTGEYTDRAEQLAEQGWEAYKKVYRTDFLNWFWRRGGWNDRWEAPRTELASVVAYQQLQGYFNSFAYDDRVFTGLEPEGGSEALSIQAKIDTYWKNKIPEMIMQDSPAAAERVYREALAHIRGLGLDTLKQARNARFQANKNRLGVEHGWPPLK